MECSRKRLILSFSYNRGILFYFLFGGVARHLETQFFLGLNTQLLSQRFQFFKILLVLALVLDLGLDTFKDTDGGGIVVDATGSLESRLNHRGSRDKIVCESVVETALKFKQIVNVVKELDVAFGEGFEALVFVAGRVESLADSYNSQMVLMRRNFEAHRLFTQGGSSESNGASGSAGNDTSQSSTEHDWGVK